MFNLILVSASHIPALLFLLYFDKHNIVCKYLTYIYVFEASEAQDGTPISPSPFP